MFERRSYGPKFEAMGADAVRHALDRGRISEPEATHARIWLRQLRHAHGGAPVAADDTARAEAIPGAAPRAPAGPPGEALAVAQRALAAAQRARAIALLALAVAIVGTVVAVSIAWLAAATPAA